MGRGAWRAIVRGVTKSQTQLIWYSLKSRSMIPPALFFLKILLATHSLLCFHTNLKIFCSGSEENAIGNLIGIALNL